MSVSQTLFNPARYQLLQRASFLQGDAARKQFLSWNAQINWDAHLNTDEYRLLPQLVRNLSAQNYEHALFGKFRGIARKAWVTNNLSFRELGPTLRKLREAEIEALLLYGGAFALHYDTEYPLAYNASDCGILVREHQARDTYQFLARNGWKPTPDIPANVLDNYFTARFFHTFQNARGEQIILQWQLIPHCNGVDADAEFWRDAQETNMSEGAALTLNPTAQLAHTALFGAHARGATPIQRASDVMILLNAAHNEIEWQKVFAVLTTHRVVLPTRETFNYAARELNVPIPSDVLQKLDMLPIALQEKSERALWSATTKWERAEKIWRVHARRACEKNVVKNGLGFAGFLRDWWGLDSVMQLPMKASKTI